MKKILKTMFIIFGLIFLVSCMDNYKEVNLSYEEAKEELSGVELANEDTLELDINLLMESVETDDFITLEASALLNNNQLVLDINLELLMLEAEVEGSGLFYLVNDGMYLDGNINVKTNDEEVKIEGKKKLTAFEGLFDEDININELIDIDLDEIINDPKFKEFVEDYEGLTFYKHKDNLKLRFEINEELYNKHKDLFEENSDDEFISFDENMELVLELTVKDKKVTNIKVDLNMENEDMKLTLNIEAKLTNKKLELPNFNEFEDVEV